MLSVLMMPLTDEMRTMMGTDSIRQGTFNVFNMFQHKQLNKRFLFVFLEGVLETLFPENKFDHLFRKQHSRSQRVKDAISKREKAGPTINNLRKRPVRRWQWFLVFMGCLEDELCGCTNFRDWCDFRISHHFETGYQYFWSVFLCNVLVYNFSFC